MGWLTRTTIYLLVFAAFCISRNVYGQEIIPRSSPRLAESFMNSFMDSLIRSAVFTADEISDIGMMSDTITDSIDRMTRSGKSSNSMLQALNMAFASAVGEIAVTEEGGASLNQKGDVIANSLAQAFVQTTGVVNQKFFNEIKELISMFSQSQFNEVSSSAAASAGFGGYGLGSGVGVATGVGAAGGVGYATGLGTGAGGAGAGGPEDGLYQVGYNEYTTSTSTSSVSTTDFRPAYGYGNGSGSGAGETAAGAGAGGAGGYGPGYASGAVAGNYGPRSEVSTTVSNSISRLSSYSSVSRISSAVQSLVQNGGPNLNSLSNVTSSIQASVAASNPGLSGCEVGVQTHLEVVSALVHILSSASVSNVDVNTSQSLNAVASAVSKGMG